MNSAQLGMIAVNVIMAVIMCVTPRMSRRGLFFGLNVTPDFAAGPAARRIYRLHMIALAATTVLACAITAVEVKMSAVGLLLLLATQLAVTWWARSEGQAYGVAPIPVRAAALVPRRASLPGGWFAWLLPLALPVASLVLIDQRWDSLPSRIPMHWGIDGQPDRWEAKSPGTVRKLPVAGLCTGLALVLMAWQVARSRQISPIGEAAESESGRRYFTLRTLLAIHWFIGLLFSLITSQMLGLTGPRPMLFLSALLTVGLLLQLFLFWRYAQQRQDLEPPQDGTSDDYWYLGMIYANPRDPSVLVENRIGFGYTLNFGRPWAWLILVLAMAPGMIMSLVR